MQEASTVSNYYNQQEQSASPTYADESQQQASANDQAQNGTISNVSAYVGNLHPTTTKEDLESHFASCGAIKRVAVPVLSTGEIKGCAYVEFEEPDGLQRAIQLHNTTVKSNTIDVFAKRDTVRDYRGRGRGFGRGRGYGMYGTQYNRGGMMPYGRGMSPYGNPGYGGYGNAYGGYGYNAAYGRGGSMGGAYGTAYGGYQQPSVYNPYGANAASAGAGMGTTAAYGNVGGAPSAYGRGGGAVAGRGGYGY